MIELEIPQRGKIELKHAVFDVNGTLAVDGILVPEAVFRLKILAEFLSLHILTAGTQGNLTEIEHTLGLPLHVIKSGEEKECYIKQLGPTNVIAFGNGETDIGMLRLAAIGIVVLTEEGIAIKALQAADVMVNGPVNAIDLLLKPKRLIATMRK
jgi:soluble P-type ATPase